MYQFFLGCLLASVISAQEKKKCVFTPSVISDKLVFTGKRYIFSEKKFDHLNCNDFTYKIDTNPTDYIDRIFWQETKTAIEIYIDMMDVAEPFAV